MIRTRVAGDDLTAALARQQRWVDRQHFNPADPAHCDACFRHGERRLVAGVVEDLRQRGVLSPKEKRRMATAELRPRLR